MQLRHVVLTDRSSAGISFGEIQHVAQALQVQVDRDFSPEWGTRAQIVPIPRDAAIPAHTWPMFLLDQPEAGLGIHLDPNHHPFAEVQATPDWSITASHELLEM